MGQRAAINWNFTTRVTQADTTWNIPRNEKTLLSDIDGPSFKTLGILNDQYQPGDERYGIPLPGMIIVSPDGTVVGKLLIEAYSSRVDSDAALAFAKTELNII